MKSRWMSFALVAALALILVYQSVLAASAAPVPHGAGKVVASPASSCGLLSFTHHEYQFNEAANNMTTGDFNGDGKPDIVAASYIHDIVVMLNDGSGGLGAPVTYTVSITNVTAAVAVADFNADGRLDIAVAVVDGQADLDNSVVIFLGHGDGTFQMGSSLMVDAYPEWIGTADFNKDGKPDVLTIGSYSVDMNLLLGNGDGTFQPLRRLRASEIVGPAVIRDLNADGNLDIAVINQEGNNVETLLGNGDGTFQSPSFLPAGREPLGLVAGDFNGDSNLDLAFATGYHGYHPSLALLRGDGHGQFGIATNYYQPYIPIPLVAGDFNGDGITDIARPGGAADTVAIVPGSAAGFTDTVEYDAGGGVTVMATADMNADGKPDLLIIHNGYLSTTISVLLNTCAPSTLTPPTSTPTAPSPPTSTPYPTNPPCPVPFTDISGNPFYQAIQYLYCTHTLNGLSNTTYGPAGTADRAQFAKVLVTGFGLLLHGQAHQPDFSDVPVSHYAYHYVEIGYEAGILNGFDRATCAANSTPYPCYLPERPITRGQLTKMVVLTAFYQVITPATPSFTDVPATNPFYSYIETAYANHLISGYPDHTFRPNQNIRRDEMAQIIYTAVTDPNWQLRMAAKAAHKDK